MLYEAPEPEPPGFVTKGRPVPAGPERDEEMTKAPGTAGTGGGKRRPEAAEGRKERLAEALRRNLVKRKDKKETNPDGKSSAD